MTKFIGVISGKGGVGKTTCTINIAVALSNFGRHVVVIDGNTSTPNIGISLGVPKFKTNLNDALAGIRDITTIAHRHSSGIMIIPSDIKYNIAGSNYNHLKEKIKLLKDRTEVVLVDTCSGLNTETAEVIKAVDDVLIITTPDLNSVTDSIKSIKFAEENGANVLGVIVNRVKRDHFELSLTNIREMLEKPIMGFVNEDDSVRKSFSIKQPVVYSIPDSIATHDFKKLASKIIGDEYIEGLKLKEKLTISHNDFFLKRK